MKTCRACGEQKPQEQFHTEVKAGVTYYRSICRPCRYKENQASRVRRRSGPPKTCKVCSVEQPATEFKSGLTCRGCERMALREYSRKRYDPRASKAKHLKWKYGITIEQYEAMVEAQEGHCAMCERRHTKSRPLHVDHCHKTGVVRGLLCIRCNLLIGHAGDDPAEALRLVQSMERYLAA
jgi:hypothetical protein